jgi:ribonucleoside-diphosphate reductase alpha chain
MAYDAACKGVTVYRDGCRQHQPMAHQPETDRPVTPQPAGQAPRRLEPVELPEVCSAVRTRQMTPFGNMHVQITVDPRTGRELEVFAQLGKGGDLANSDLEAICRMVSLWLRSGGELCHVVRQLKGIGSSLQVSTKQGKIMSLGDGLARALRKYERAKSRFGLTNLLLGNFDPQELDREVTCRRQSSPQEQPTNGNGKTSVSEHRSGNGNGNGRGEDHQVVRHGGTDAPPASDRVAGGRSSQYEQYKVLCPECQSTLRFVEGCRTCESCGHSAC